MNHLTLLPDGLVNTLTRARDRLPVSRSMVQEFEMLIAAAPAEVRVPPRAFTVRHHFSPGIYMRELHVPQGLITTGKIHKYPCMNILAKGKRATLIEDHISVVTAPHVHMSPAGMKRISYTLEDAVWITVHPTDKTDVAELERDLVCDTEEEYQAFLASGVSPECLS